LDGVLEKAARRDASVEVCGCWVPEDSFGLGFVLEAETIALALEKEKLNSRPNSGRYQTSLQKAHRSMGAALSFDAADSILMSSAYPERYQTSLQKVHRLMRGALSSDAAD